MKIAFLSLYNAFDVTHIGGVDATVRRLSNELIQQGYQIEHVHYGSPADSQETHNDIGVFHFGTFKQALNHVKASCTQLVTIYLLPRDRIPFARFRLANRQITFSHIYFTFPESRLKRLLMMLDAWVVPFSGRLFAVSPRLVKLVPWGKGQLLWPPVPTGYFRKKSSGPADTLRMTFMGRIDPNKGTGEALELFRTLKQRGVPIHARICGYPWKHKPETMALHDALLAQSDVVYEPRKFDGFSPEIEQYVSDTLAETDVLVLPYRKLSSTIDTPMLLLEGMAHDCVVLTRPLGDMPTTFGSEMFMFEQFADVENIDTALVQLKNNVDAERTRIARQADALKFETPSVAKQFLQGLGI